MTSACGNNDDLVLVDLDGAPGVLHEGYRVGAQEVFSNPQSDDLGEMARRDDDRSRLVAACARRRVKVLVVTACMATTVRRATSSSVPLRPAMAPR